MVAFALSGRSFSKSSGGKAYKPLTFSFLLNQETDGGDFDALWNPIGGMKILKGNH